MSWSVKIIFAAASGSEVILKSGINFKIHQPEKDVDKHDCSLSVEVLIHQTGISEIRHVRLQSQFKHLNVFTDAQLCCAINLSKVAVLIHDNVMCVITLTSL